MPDLEHYKKLAEKKHWKKLQSAYEKSNEETRLLILEALGSAAAVDEVLNILINEVNFPLNEQTQIAAINALGSLGSQASRAKEHLTHQMNHLDEAAHPELAQALRSAMTKMKTSDFD
ncbi:MAG: hypothetical protein PHR21_05160 [Oscillospiraceae bacterium]|nr:hypothetical protein [Oscillospiraceae bacterium]MDD4367838.1 hypothetical protein [Oscillospiraceae bacterium]